MIFLNFYSENTNIGEKKNKQKRKRHTPLNPPSMGEYIEQFASLEECHFRSGLGAFHSSFLTSPSSLPSPIKGEG
ncbi:MAG: hypothetical protein QUS12_11860, partial [Methanosarcina sp.]|nr:hypothetical protein [Methanosarcina sp.]